MQRVALTGGIASGKSYCLARFAAAGLPTVDADVLAREVVTPGTPGFAEVVAQFGPGIRAADGTIDRRALGRRIFTDAASRRALEKIIHPRVYAAIHDWFAARTREGVRVAIADVPLLYETAHESDFDLVIVAACPEPMQVARVMARDRLSEAEARSRVASQLPLADKARRANFVIDTAGTTAQTDQQIDAVVRAFHHDGHEAHED
jgi:dephospho-CoA kinase